MFSRIYLCRITRTLLFCVLSKLHGCLLVQCIADHHPCQTHVQAITQVCLRKTNVLSKFQLVHFANAVVAVFSSLLRVCQYQHCGVTAIHVEILILGTRWCDLLLSTFRDISFGKGQICNSCTLMCPETIQQTTCAVRWNSAWLPDASISYYSTVQYGDHRSRQAVFSPLCSCVNKQQVPRLTTLYVKMQAMEDGGQQSTISKPDMQWLTVSFSTSCLRMTISRNLYQTCKCQLFLCLFLSLQLQLCMPHFRYYVTRTTKMGYNIKSNIPSSLTIRFSITK